MKVSGYLYKAALLPSAVLVFLIIRLFVLIKQGRKDEFLEQLDGVYAVAGVVIVCWAIGAVAKLWESARNSN